MPLSGVRDVQTQNYDNFTIKSHYSRDEGLLVLPVAAPFYQYDASGNVVLFNGQPLEATPVPPRRIRLHHPIGMRIVNWMGDKMGSPPMMPSMRNTPSGDVFLGGDVHVDLPALEPNQTSFRFVSSGSYSYSQETVRKAQHSDPIVVGAAQATANNLRSVFHTGIFPFSMPLITELADVLPGLIGQSPGELDYTNQLATWLFSYIPSVSFSDDLIL